MNAVKYKRVDVDGFGIAYREAGPVNGYASNVEMYPKFQKYFRCHQPPLLAVWGNGDPFFLPAGAEAFKRDIKDAKVMFFDTGHFALETHCDEIGLAIRSFLAGVDVMAPPTNRRRFGLRARCCSAFGFACT